MAAACAGDDRAMEILTLYYWKALISKDDLATALRAHKVANDKGKNEPREYAIRYKAFLDKVKSVNTAVKQRRRI